MKTSVKGQVGWTTHDQFPRMASIFPFLLLNTLALRLVTAVATKSPLPCLLPRRTRRFQPTTLLLGTRGERHLPMMHDLFIYLLSFLLFFWGLVFLSLPIPPLYFGVLNTISVLLADFCLRFPSLETSSLSSMYIPPSQISVLCPSKDNRHIRFQSSVFAAAFSLLEFF